MIFENVLAQWPTLLASARRVDSPNPEDDLAIKPAFVGFSIHAPTEQWSRAHFQVIADYRHQELTEPVLAGWSNRWELFATTAVGALLGAFVAQQIDERTYDLGLMLLPGFMWQKCTDIEDMP
ncbi:MAG TPA: hypothetical protein VI078_10085 [bacterium]